ncbi:MAG: hypothetical protein ACREYF_22495 [Gammaproteobacteria bacterium]
MPMETVSFITTETGNDLIVSFAVCAADDPMQVESLTLLRTPKYESLLDDSERGVTVSYGLDTDEDDFLEEVHFDEDSAVVRLKTELRIYELDVRKVERRDLKAMRKVFRAMNFDDRVQLSGV